MSWDAAHAIATIAGTAAAVIAAILGGNAVLTRLIVRDELRVLPEQYVPRKEAQVRDADVERRLDELSARVGAR